MSWSDLFTLAMLGTQRAQIPPALLEEATKVGLPTDQDPAALVLQLAAYYLWKQKAGYLPDNAYQP